jgi:signal transduction histidine kinase/ligand-binding sensor domain-containing protein
MAGRARARHLMRSRFAFATLLTALWAWPAAALDPTKSLSQCTVDVWQVRDGLPGAAVRGITQTPDGYLWINAAGGMARYDGARLTRLEAPRSMELHLFDVQDLLVRDDGTLWLGPAYSDPLCLRRDSLVRCLSISLGLGESERINATAIHGDEIWVATKLRLLRLDHGRLSADLKLAQLPFAHVNALHADRQGRLWVGASNGLFVGRDGHFAPVPGPEGPDHPVLGFVLSMFETPGGRLWIATTSSLIRIEDDRTTVFTRHDGFPPARASQVIEDRDGNVWIGTEAGLVRYRDGHFTVFDQHDGLPDANVTALFEDREGSLWVGMRGGGLAQFTDRTLVTTAGPSLSDQQVQTVSEDSEGALWIGSRTGGATRWKDGQATNLTTADQLPANHVTAIVPATSGGVWIGTARGLVRWQEGHLDAPTAQKVAVSSLFVDPAGSLWIGGDNGFVGRWRNDRLDKLAPPEGGRWGQVRGLQEDEDGRLLVMAIGGLARLEGDRLVRIAPPGATTVWGRSLTKDGDGSVWIGTMGGGLLHLAHGRFTAFTAAQGIVPDQLYQAIVDDDGAVWAGTSRGILRVSKASLVEIERGQRQRADVVSFERSDQHHDVAADSVHQPSAWKCKSGRLLFATEQGVVSIDPRRLRANAVPPSVLVQEAMIDGRRARRGERNRFPPGPGNLELHFAAITLLEPEKAVHRYLLEGFDEHWVDAGTRRVAYYTNIPPGRYRFRVQASNADGLWNEAGDTLEFYLAPHFYRTFWFYGLVAMGVLSLGYWFHRSRLLRVRAEALAAAGERTRVARELHDTLLQEMSAVAMLIHAVRITLPAAAAGVGEKLSKIEATVTASLAQTRRFVWDLRDPPERREDAPTQLGQALSRLASEASNDEVQCTARIEGEPVALAPAVPEELLRIAQEALANARKHAGARYIRLRLCYEETGVRLVVSDDGRGFDPEATAAAKPGHFGLVGLRERATTLGATLSLESHPGRGTNIEVVVPHAARASAHG